MIRPAEPIDGQSLANLYNYYVINSVTTFETESVAAAEMSSRVAAVRASGLPWLVLS